MKIIYQGTVIGTPVGKPRMTRRTTWTPQAQRYFAYAKIIRQSFGLQEDEKILEDIDAIVMKCYLPIPKSTSGKKTKLLYNTPHKKSPDVDNIAKSVMDSLFENDGCVNSLFIEKFYIGEGEEPRIEISLLNRHTLELME